MSRLKKFVIFLLVLVIAFPVGVYGYFYTKLSAIHDPSIDNTILNSKDFKNQNGITNILLLGTDARPGEGNSRSDSMMILTVDSKNNSIKLTSLARDTYVDIPGHGKQKLTHAYVYGKSNLLIETIENNFEIDIQNYATVDFLSFMHIIDLLGGVSVNVAADEIRELNKFIPETYKWDENPDKGDMQLIETSGEQTLNGYQALAFSRIRKNDSAMERDRRQRDVIQGLIKGVKELPPTQYPKLMNTILPYVKTNMKPNSIFALGLRVLKIGNLDLKQFEFPIDDGVHSTGGIYGKAGWVLRFEPDSLQILHDFIFEDIEYTK